MNSSTAREGGWPSGEAGPGGALVFLPEPGECAGRLDPGQALIPDVLARRLDFHVQPSVSPWAISPMARTVCEHIDYESLHSERPELFERRQQFGTPAIEQMWEAKHLLAELGYHLCLDVQIEDVDGELALVVFGAGVVGRLTDRAWAAVAGILTTDSSSIVEPVADVSRFASPVRPARPSTSRGKRKLPTAVTPLGWQVGDWAHTWWGYPLFGAPGAHVVPAEFGPGARNVA
ncbi:hypothetical protein BS329_15640 [Amycolatopsis coloradensis]|uniref:Uncharacterized protein n=1 Tax=Amycolatopsis coloradensis TaxID=76021 RepID=A0A1R0KUK0_9PSEU|nr:hypothetical protein [Amycolatopsis coloradensis]OLZ51696.1 hypothetical protein BS329_15640 [Amycolatopsis coloradensis]